MPITVALPANVEIVYEQNISTAGEKKTLVKPKCKNCYIDLSKLFPKETKDKASKILPTNYTKKAVDKLPLSDLNISNKPYTIPDKNTTIIKK